MKSLRVRALVLCLCVSPLALQAQTWVGGFGGNVVNNGSNWTSPSGIPGAGANLTFGASANTGVGFPGGFTTNGLTFTNLAPKYFLNGNNVGALSIGAGGFTTISGAQGVDISGQLAIALTANQTWTTASGANVTTSGAVSGAFTLTKEGTGYLVLSGNNSYSGGTTINAGAVYLGSINSSTGTIAVGSSGTLGAAFGDVTLGNNITLANGATLGGSPNGFGSSLEFANTGTVTVAGTTANFTVGAKSDAFFAGTLTAALPSTALTVQSDGTGIAILGGTVSNITSITADNSAVAFGNTGALPTSIQAINGGYVSVAEIGATTPGSTAVLDKIINRGSFNGTLGFDTSEEAGAPHVFNTAIDLSAQGSDFSSFVDGNIRIGSATQAVLGSSAVITPVAQMFRFGGYAGQGGALVVQSDLVDHNLSATGVSVVSPTAGGGAAQDGFLLILQGNNSFTGNVSVTESSLILDSANALPGSTTISLGDRAYAGYTENGATSFANFVTRIASNNATSIIGIDSASIINGFITDTSGSVRTITGETINLSGRGAVYLGTMTGATIDATSTIVAPTGGPLRLVSMADEGFTINAVLNHSNGMVVGMTGSEGAVILNGVNTFSGNTSLEGGRLFVGNSSALSGGSLSITNSGNDTVVLAAATPGITLTNNIAVTGQATIGKGGFDDSSNAYLADTTNGLTLTTGVISGTGSLYLTGPTTLGGTNTYSGGTLVRADATVTSNAGLGTGPVTLGYRDSANKTRSVLTFSSATPTIYDLSNANSFTTSGGPTNVDTGNIVLQTGVNLTINQTINQGFGGTISGVGGLTKTGIGSLTLGVANSYTGATFVNAGTLIVANSLASSSVTVANGATLMGTGTLNDVTLNGTYRPGPPNGTSLVILDSLTMSSTGLLHMELGGTTRGTNYDALNIVNTTTGTGALFVDGTLSVTFINGFNPSLGNTFDLFDPVSFTGTFDTLNLQALSGGLAWNTSLLYTTGVISVAAIPEPSTYAALAGLGALGLAIWRRRSARAAVQVAARY